MLQPNVSGSANQDASTESNRSSDVNATSPHPATNRDEHFIDRYGTYAALLSLACYIVGVATVNSYLVRIGVSDFAVLRTRFVLTGIMVIISLCGLVLLVVNIVMAFRYVLGLAETPDKEGSSMRQRLPPLFVSILLVALLLSYLGNLQFRSYLLDINNQGVFIIVLTLISPLVYVAVTDPRHNESSAILHNRISRLSRAYVMLMILVVYIDFFSGTIFPAVPQQLGGGQASQVVLLLDAGSGDRLRVQIPLIMKNESSTLPVDLLWETDTMYVVREIGNQNANVLHIDKDSVIGVIGEPQLRGLINDPMLPFATPQSRPTDAP